MIPAETIIINTLDVCAVLDAHGIDHDGTGEQRLRECPACGHRSARGAASINAESGLGRCFRCGATWNAYTLLAALEGLDLERDRRRLLERAAELAGLDGAAPEAAAQRTAEVRAERAQKRAEHAAKVQRARAGMPAMWDALMPRHAGGEAYLRDERWIDPRGLVDVVRYRPTRQGEPALPLRDLTTGAVAGIQHRLTLPNTDGRKTINEKHSQVQGAALHGKLTDLDEGCDVAVIAEGFADTLAAVLAFPTCAVFGAAGAGELAAVAAAVAPRIAELRGWLVLVPHDDEAGADGAAEAIAAAVESGLQLAAPDAGLDGASTVRLVDLDGHGDLADAWRSDWRYSWPARRAS